MKKEEPFFENNVPNHFITAEAANEELLFARKNGKTPNAKIFEKGKYYAKNPNFLLKVKDLRFKWNIPADGFPSGDLTNWYVTQPFYSDKSLFKEYLEDLDIILKQINEEGSWKDFCEYYLLYNEVNPFAYPQKITVSIRKNSQGDNTEILIHVKAPVSNASEFSEAVKRAIHYSKEIYGDRNTRPTVNFERDMQIFELYLRGVGNVEISNIINDNPIYKTILNYADVADIIKDIKKRIARP